MPGVCSVRDASQQVIGWTALLPGASPVTFLERDHGPSALEAAIDAQRGAIESALGVIPVSTAILAWLTRAWLATGLDGPIDVSRLPRQGSLSWVRGVRVEARLVVQHTRYFQAFSVRVYRSDHLAICAALDFLREVADLTGAHSLKNIHPGGGVRRVKVRAPTGRDGYRYFWVAQFMVRGRYTRATFAAGDALGAPKEVRARGLAEACRAAYLSACAAGQAFDYQAWRAANGLPPQRWVLS